MPCVSKPTCVHVIIISLWLICRIQCGFSISYLSIPGIAAQDRCNISHVFTFSFQLSCGVLSIMIILICFVFNPLCKRMWQCFMSPCSFLMPQDKEQQSHSLPVILIYLIFVTTTFRDVFKSLQFFLIFHNQRVKSMKNVAQQDFAFREVSDNNLKFS